MRSPILFGFLAAVVVCAGCAMKHERLSVSGEYGALLKNKEAEARQIRDQVDDQRRTLEKMRLQLIRQQEIYKERVESLKSWAEKIKVVTTEVDARHKELTDLTAQFQAEGKTYSDITAKFTKLRVDLPAVKKEYDFLAQANKLKELTASLEARKQAATQIEAQVAKLTTESEQKLAARKAALAKATEVEHKKIAAQEAALKNAATEAAKAVAARQAELDAAKALLAKTDAAFGPLKAQQDQKAAQLAQLQKDAAARDQDFNATQSALADKVKAVEALQTSLQAATSEAAGLGGKLEQLQSGMAQKKHAVAQTQARLAIYTDRLAFLSRLLASLPGLEEQGRSLLAAAHRNGAPAGRQPVAGAGTAVDSRTLVIK